MFKRKGQRTLPLGHKPAGRQRVRLSKPSPAGASSRVRYGKLATQAPAGTQTSTLPGVFSSAAGGSGFRTLEAPPLARAPIQRTTLGFFAPFAVRAGMVAEPPPGAQFAAPARQPAPPATPARSTVFPAPVVYTAQPVGSPVKVNPQRSDVFPVPR